MRGEGAFEVLVQARALEATGRDVVHMEIGEPDFPTPPHIVAAGQKALADGYTKYGPTQGDPELRQAIADYISSTRGIPVSESQVVVTPGAKPILFFSMLALLEPGDEAMYPNPGFPMYESVIGASGAKPVPLPLLESRGFSIDLDRFSSLLSDRTRLIILNSPQNPTGGTIPPEDLQAIADMVRDRDLLVLSDEIYNLIAFDERPTSIASLEGMAEKTIILDGFSKAYSMTGWRIGYGAGPKELIAAMSKIQSQTTSGASSISQWAGVEALDGDQAFIRDNVAVFEERRDLGVSILNQAKGLSCNSPDGAFYLYVDCRETLGKRTPDGGTIENDGDFAKYLLDSEEVAVVHGDAFGLSPYFRISYALATDRLEEACMRIQRACASLSG
jgi:aspartate aminotransferase